MFTELIGNESLTALLASLGRLLTIFFGGAVTLTLAVALAARIAAIPLVEAVARMRSGRTGLGEGELG